MPVLLTLSVIRPKITPVPPPGPHGTISFKGPAASTAYWKKTFTKWKEIATKVGMYKGG